MGSVYRLLTCYARLSTIKTTPRCLQFLLKIWEWSPVLRSVQVHSRWDLNDADEVTMPNVQVWCLPCR